MDLVYAVVIGLAAGWLAGIALHGKGFGLLGNLIVGVAGALIGGFVFRIVGLAPTSLLGQLISATAGAIILLLLVGVVVKSSRER